MPRALNTQSYQKLRRLLSKARLDAGLTQAETAKRIKRPQSFVSKYEQGERRLDVVEFMQVCKALGVSASALLASFE